MSPFRKNLAYLIFAQGLNYLIPLLIFPYLARILGAVNFGKLSFATTIVLYCCICIDFGFIFSATKKIAELNRKNLPINQVFWDVLFAKLVIFLIVLLVVFIIGFTNEKINDVFNIVIVLIPQMIASLIFPLWYFQAIENIKIILLSQVIAKLSILPLTFILVKNSNDVLIAAIIQSMAFLIAASLSWIYIFKNSDISKPNTNVFNNFLVEIKDSSAFFLGGLAISVYTISTPILIGFASSNYEVGIYSAADKFRAAIAGIFIITGGAIFPRVNILFIENRASAFLFLKKILMVQVIILVFTCILYIKFGPSIIGIILGSTYSESAKLTNPLAVALFCSVISVILCNYILIPLGHKSLYYKIPLIVCILHVIYTWLLIKSFGSYGASLGIAISEIVTILLLLVFCIKYGYLKELILAK
ncbi:flippase [Psychrobacter immobilis]|uniref:flippase n=1 Tax=Psychrobacter immobilis TaxID=498 RepID=UPI00191B1F5A|nr:flippase [Psychrobacter immobilis]